MRTKIKNYSLIIISIFIFVFLLASCGKSKGYRSIKIEILNGDVLVTRGDKEIEAYKDMKLSSGDNIQTKDESNVIFKLDDDKYIYIGDNSNVDLVAEKNKTNIRVNEGSIVTEVKNKLSDFDKFEVEAPNSTMAIRGTTFGVKVIKTTTGFITSYRLVSGKIDVKALDGKGDNLIAGLFHMDPMNEIEITATGDGVLAGSDLTDAINNLNDNNTTEYENTSDFISSTNNVSLVSQVLDLEDIQDIIKVLPTNHDDGVNRVVTLNSSFDIREKNLFNQFLAESKNTFNIKVSAFNKPNNPVDYWLINGEVVEGGSIIDVTVDKSMVIEPVYLYEEHDVLVQGSIYSSVKYKDVNEPYGYDDLDGGIYLSNGEYEFVVENVVSETYPSYRFIGWVEITPDGDNLPIKALVSTNSRYQFTITKDVTIEPLFINTQGDYETYLINRSAENIDYALIEKNDQNWKDDYLVKVTTQNEILLMPLLLTSIKYNEAYNDIDLSKLSSYSAEASFFNNNLKVSFNVLVYTNSNITIAPSDISYELAYDYYTIDGINVSYNSKEVTVSENIQLNNTSGSIRLDINENSIDGNYIFVGYYKVDGNNLELLSNYKTDLIELDGDATIKAVFVLKSEIEGIELQDKNGNTINSVSTVKNVAINFENYDVLLKTSNGNYAISSNDYEIEAYVYNTGNTEYQISNLATACSDTTTGTNNPYVVIKSNNFESSHITINVYDVISNLSSAFILGVNSDSSTCDNIKFEDNNGIFTYSYMKGDIEASNNKELFLSEISNNYINVNVSPSLGVFSNKILNIYFDLPTAVSNELYNYRLYKYNKNSKKLTLVEDTSDISLLYQDEVLIMAANYIDLYNNDVDVLISSNLSNLYGNYGLFTFQFYSYDYLFNMSIYPTVDNAKDIDVAIYDNADLDYIVYDSNHSDITESDTLALVGDPTEIIIKTYNTATEINFTLNSANGKNYVIYKGEGILEKLDDSATLEVGETLYLVNTDEIDMTNIYRYSQLEAYMSKDSNVIMVTFIKI